MITRDKGYLNMSVLLMNLSAVHGTNFRTDYLKVFTFSLCGAVQVGWFLRVFPFFSAARMNRMPDTFATDGIFAITLKSALGLNKEGSCCQICLSQIKVLWFIVLMLTLQNKGWLNWIHCGVFSFFFFFSFFFNSICVIWDEWSGLTTFFNSDLFM